MNRRGLLKTLAAGVTIAALPGAVIAGVPQIDTVATVSVVGGFNTELHHLWVRVSFNCDDDEWHIFIKENIGARDRLKITRKMSDKMAKLINKNLAAKKPGAHVLPSQIMAAFA